MIDQPNLIDAALEAVFRQYDWVIDLSDGWFCYMCTGECTIMLQCKDDRRQIIYVNGKFVLKPDPIGPTVPEAVLLKAINILNKCIKLNPMV